MANCIGGQGKSPSPRKKACAAGEDTGRLERDGSASRKIAGVGLVAVAMHETRVETLFWRYPQGPKEVGC